MLEGLRTQRRVNDRNAAQMGSRTLFKKNKKRNEVPFYLRRDLRRRLLNYNERVGVNRTIIVIVCNVAKMKRVSITYKIGYHILDEEKEKKKRRERYTCDVF